MLGPWAERMPRRSDAQALALAQALAPVPAQHSAAESARTSPFPPPAVLAARAPSFFAEARTHLASCSPKPVPVKSTGEITAM